MEPKLTERSALFDKCYDELSEKARHDLDFRLFALNLYCEGLGEKGAKELIIQIARQAEKIEAKKGD